MKTNYVVITSPATESTLEFTLKTLNVAGGRHTPSPYCYYVPNGSDVLDVVAKQLKIPKDELQGSLTIPIASVEDSILHHYTMASGEDKNVYPSDKVVLVNHPNHNIKTNTITS